MPETEVWNLYSICETHDISVARLTEGCAGKAEFSVGKPMPYLQPVVLDDNDVPCPAGQPGRLHFKGPRMLGPGYINRPKETAARFRSLTAGGKRERLYDTGDLGRVSPDGEIYVMGRSAHMLKLRGHSIQMQELTDTLADVLQFARAIPWIQKDETQNDVLVFYYTATPAQQAANETNLGLTPKIRQSRLTEAFRKRLAPLLPEYCLPSIFVRLDEMPINPVSGKCDYKALPKISFTKLNIASAASCETILPTLKIAAEILHCRPDTLDPELPFTDLGGDSLKGIDYLMRLNEAYGRNADFELVTKTALGLLHTLLVKAPETGTHRSLTKKTGFLLTGASGFLGRRVLKSLDQTLSEDQVIYCLIRPRENSAEIRLRQLLSDAGISRSRVVLLETALETPHFGLSQKQYRELCERVSTVIHCAATVNLSISSALMSEWVMAGLRPLLKFCHQAQADLRFSSTTAVFADTGGPHPEAASLFADRPLRVRVFKDPSGK